MLRHARGLAARGHRPDAGRPAPTRPRRGAVGSNRRIHTSLRK
ncbi:hypothetical protein [Lysobacter gummosus]